jgi:flagellar hook-associated protein 2
MKVGKSGQGVGPMDSNRSMVDDIMEAQRAPIDRTERLRDRTIEEKNDYASLGNLLSELKGTVGDLATPSKFNRFKADSSHPDILDASVVGAVTAGNFEFEVRGLAEADKHLAFGFPDINETPVGFGYMAIEKENGDLIDVDIEPGSTLQDVARSINDKSKDFRAQIVNTGFAEDPFRLMVASTKTGEAASIHIDEDTTFLDFKNIKKGRNLDVMFDDVQVTGAENKLDKLLDGLSIDLKRAEPGTKVTLNVKPDIDASAASIPDFIAR